MLLKSDRAQFGGKTCHGKVPRSANLFLRWAFIEAANCIVVHQRRLKGRHVVDLYQRLKAAKGHGKAAVAVARHLAEASWWVLNKQQPYREPNRTRILGLENPAAARRWGGEVKVAV